MLRPPGVYVGNGHRVFVIAIVMIPILANAAILTGVVNCDPAIHFSGLGEILSRWPFVGNDCFVDPTVGQITQPLGYISARDWLHGIVPWWNPYTGVGMPLAAEMQTESFFLPFILLLYFHSGWLLQKISCQILSGLFTYAFLGEIGLTKAACMLGGILFSLNGTFVLTPHAVIAPIFCLPLLLLGIERSFDAARNDRPMGWSLIVLALAGSIYAGFPEVAFFDALLAVVWAVYRFFLLNGHAQYGFAVKVIYGGLIGLLLTTPLTSAFFQYLSQAEIGSHKNYYLLDVLPKAAAPLQMFPLFYGAIDAGTPGVLTADFGNMWVRIGGWFGCTPVLLMLLAMCCARRRDAARYLMFGWVLLWEARYFGFPGVSAIVSLIPGVAQADTVRFSPVSVEFAVVVLAACGFDDILGRLKLSKTGILIWIFLSVAMAALSLFPALKEYSFWFNDHPNLYRMVCLYFVAVLGLSIFFVTSVVLGRFKTTIAVLVIAESMAVFVFSQSGAPRVARLNTNGVPVLNVAKDFGRIYTTSAYAAGGFSPDYPAAYDIASINYEALPVPKLWTGYIKSALFAGADPIVFAGGEPGQDLALLTHLPTYEELGIRYVTVSPNDRVFSVLNGPLAQPNFNAYIHISNTQDYKNTLRPRIWPDNLITHVSVIAGTDFGASTGFLHVSLCSAGHCSSGQASLAKAADNQPLMIPLDHPIIIQGGQPLSYRFFIQGNFVSLWLPPTLDNGTGSIMVSPLDRSVLEVSRNFDTPAIPRVYHDDRMDIYRLPDAAPYAQTGDSSCSLNIYSRQKMDADCAHPTTLERRELFYPGWGVKVNGVAVPIMKAEDIFQQISLPAGHSKIRFTYMPPYTPFACAAAIAAALVWLAVGTLCRRRRKGHPTNFNRFYL